MTRTQEWKIDVFLSEEEGTTKARAVLDTGAAKLTGSGTAHCNPQDVDVPKIGDELAASRAVTNLGRRLMSMADRDLEDMGGGAENEKKIPG